MAFDTGHAVAAAIGFAAAIVAVSLWPPQSAEPRSDAFQGPPTASVSAVIQPAEPFIGVFLPAEEIDLTARIDGQVERIGVTVGQRVREGETVAVLQSTSVSTIDVALAERDQAISEIELQRALMEGEQARSRYTRLAALHKQQLISTEELEEGRSNEKLVASRTESAALAVQQRRAVVDQRRLAVSRLAVKAPFDGFISAKFVDRGSNAGTGTPIVRIVTASLKLRFAVPAEFADDVEAGQAFSAAYGQGLVFSGIIDSVAKEIDSESQLLIAESALKGFQPMATRSNSQSILAGRPVFVTLDRTSQTSRDDVER